MFCGLSEGYGGKVGIVTWRGVVVGYFVFGGISAV